MLISEAIRYVDCCRVRQLRKHLRANALPLRRAELDLLRAGAPQRDVDRSSDTERKQLGKSRGQPPQLPPRRRAVGIDRRRTDHGTRRAW
jgi:hypothetical protein